MFPHEAVAGRLRVGGATLHHKPSHPGAKLLAGVQVGLVQPEALQARRGPDLLIVR